MNTARPLSNSRVQGKLQALVLLGPPAVFLAILFLGPLVHLLIWSFQEKASGAFTLANYVAVATEGTNRLVLFNTLSTSALITALALILGYPVGFVLARAPRVIGAVMMIFVFLPFWTSVLVRAYAWTVILQRRGPVNDLLLWSGLIDEPAPLVRNTLGVIVGMTHWVLPFMILPIYSIVRGIDFNLVKAGQSLGAGPVRIFFAIVLPLSLPGVAAGCFIVFILSIGAFITPALLGGLRDTFIAQLIEQQVSTLLDWNGAAAMTIVLLGITLGLVYVFDRLLGIEKIWPER